MIEINLLPGKRKAAGAGFRLRVPDLRGHGAANGEDDPRPHGHDERGQGEDDAGPAWHATSKSLKR